MQMTQAHVAAQAGISSDTLSRLERGSLSEFGTRKLLAVLSVLGVELAFKQDALSGSPPECDFWSGGDSRGLSVSSVPVDWGRRAMEKQPIGSSDNVKLSGLRSFARIAEAWGLGEAEQARVLAMSDLPRSADDVDRLVDDMTLRRIGLVFSIYRILHTLFPDPNQADSWLRRPNSGALFLGKPAIDLLLTGDLSTIEAVRDHLDSQLG